MSNSSEKGQYRIEVLVHGHPIRVYPHQGQDYVEGRKNSEFALRVHNDSCKRVEAVITVDGLSVMTGKKGDFQTGGYLVPRYSYVDIPGWRLSDEHVARFFFAALEQSYAVLMDKPDNVGVIGCAVFEEKERPQLLGGEFLTRGGGCDTFGGDDFGMKGIGTGFGEKTKHDVTRVSFQRAFPNTPTQILSLQYGDKDQLKAWGVPLRQQPEVATLNPFPGENTGCTPPSGWRSK